MISILQNLYQDSKCAVRTNGDTSEWFNVLTGVRQGCIFSPLLFAIVMDWVMRQSTISRDFGLIWVDGARLTDLDFADDVVLIDSDVKRLQELTTVVEQEASKVGLCVNSNKCHVMVSGGWEGNADIYASGANIETVENFCYLGSYISSTGNCDQEVNVRIGKAAGIFSKLGKLRKSTKISLPVKTWLYEALVLSTLLSSAELWPVSVTQMKKT